MKSASSLIKLGRSMARNKEADSVGLLVTIDGKPVHVAGSEDMARRIAAVLNFCRTGQVKHLLQATSIILTLEVSADFSINTKAKQNA